MMNPSTPKLYGQLKNHKPEQSIRPVVAYYTAPTYKLAKFLCSTFRGLTDFKTHYGLKNSLELVNNLKILKFPVGSFFFSFDVIAMYTNIPTARAIPLLINKLRDLDISSDIINEFKDLINLCVNTNVCSFRGKHISSQMVYPCGARFQPW